MPQWVNCKHSLSLLQDYLDGTLAPDDKAALDRHFKACPPCIDFVRKYKATPRLCQRALAEEVPKDVSDRLSRFLSEKCCKPGHD
ncbi:MAG: zf-HC2 domain-containing protein [Deltaproteobacteria bacterium]|nr:zf-HC2 domain-containing protein [Deltaproteobacteria bacterium]